MKSSVYSVVIPVHNEVDSIPILLRELGRRGEIIIVDDCSTDGSSRYAAIRLLSRQGKWAALRAGIAKTHSEVIIVMDGDLQDDPREIPKLICKLDKGYDIVSSWRKNRQDPSYKILLTRAANIILGYRDFSSPFKAYRREALAQLPQEGSFLRYSLLFAKKLRLRVAEVPVGHRPRRFGSSKFGILKYFRIFWDLLFITLLFTGSGRLGDHRGKPRRQPVDRSRASVRRGQGMLS